MYEMLQFLKIILCLEVLRKSIWMLLMILRNRLMLLWQE